MALMLELIGLRMGGVIFNLGVEAMKMKIGKESSFLSDTIFDCVNSWTGARVLQVYERRQVGSKIRMPYGDYVLIQLVLFAMLRRVRHVFVSRYIAQETRLSKIPDALRNAET